MRSSGSKGMAVRPYIVTIDEEYVRGAQFFDTADMNREEFEDADSDKERTGAGLWQPLDDAAPFLGVYMAGTPGEAVRLCEEDTGFDSRTLSASSVGQYLFYAEARDTEDGRPEYIVRNRRTKEIVTGLSGNEVTFKDAFDAMDYAACMCG